MRLILLNATEFYFRALHRQKGLETLTLVTLVTQIIGVSLKGVIKNFQSNDNFVQFWQNCIETTFNSLINFTFQDPLSSNIIEIGTSYVLASSALFAGKRCFYWQITCRGHEDADKNDDLKFKIPKRHH